jgi:hypothetical protein
MNVRNFKLDDELPDEDAVEMTEESKRLAAEAEAAAAAALEDDTDDDDRDDADDSDDDTEPDDDDTAGVADSDDGGDDDDVDEARAAKKKAAEDGKPKKQTAEERIKEITEARRKAEKEAFDADMRALELEKRLEALEAKQSDTSRPAAKPKPNPDDYEYGKVDEKYAEAMIDWRAAQKEAELEEKYSKRGETDKNKELIEHYRKRHAAVASEGAKKYGDDFKIVEETNFTPELARDLLDSDQGVDISYFLANNIDQLRKMVSLEKGDRAKMLGRLEERFSAQASAGKKRTSAPETPSRKKPAAKKQVDKRYGPDDQDEFDKAFWSI